MFTDPTTPNNEVRNYFLKKKQSCSHLLNVIQRSLVQPDEPFYFADICAGPGGFSEYILWKKGWRRKGQLNNYQIFLSTILLIISGFGFTLKGKADFNLQKFLAGTPETFDPHYGVNGINGDGDIFKNENIDAFKNYVNKCTMHNGVHIVMADGVRFKENYVSYTNLRECHNQIHFDSNEEKNSSKNYSSYT